MPLMYVRMRAPGEAPGLKQLRHTLRNPFVGEKNWRFDAGEWVLIELSQAEQQYLDEYVNQEGIKLFDVAADKVKAAQIVIERKRQMAAAEAKRFPAASRGEEGRVGSDDDLLNMVTADAAARSAEELVPRMSEPDERLVAKAEAALAAERNGEPAPDPDDPEDGEDEESVENTVAVLSTLVPHEVAKAAADKFGDRLSWIVANDPDQLETVPGIGSKTVEKIKAAVGHGG